MFWLLFLCINIFTSVPVSCYNFDVDHPIIIENPDVSQNNTYFGYSVVLYSGGDHNGKWLKIGAPKGTYYDIRRRQQIQHSGIIYHCPYMEPCKADLNYTLVHNLDEPGDLTGALLGSSMDISYKYKTLLISAPKWQYFNSHGDRYSALLGGGIFVENFQYKTWQSSSPLKEPQWVNVNPRSRKDGKLTYYARAQTGFSLHFSQDENELLIGAPGVETCLGTIVEIKNVEKLTKHWENNVMRPGGNFYEYSGYAITSGCFYKKEQLYYVTGLPRGHLEPNIINGVVLIFKFKLEHDKFHINDQHDIYKRGEFYGTQFGEYFGASLAAGDLNGDELDDLIVGAPFRTNDKNGFNHGSVYVIYGHKKMLRHEPKNRIDGTVTNGLFGTAIIFLGNLDKDRFAEVAVSAPQEETSGAVYIYTFNTLTQRLMVSQKILGKNLYTSLRGFGMSFSRPNDIDDNHFSDILIGSPISGHAVLLRSKPTVLPYIRLEVPLSISDSEMTLFFKCCYSYVGYQEPTLTIVRNITVDSDQRRFYFNSTKDKEHTEEKEIILSQGRFCENVNVSQVAGVQNFDDAISISLTYKISENKTANTKNPILISHDKPIEKDNFCKKCPILSTRASKSESKLVMWDHLCGGKECVSELIVSAKFNNLRKGNSFVLGSIDYLSVEVTVLNKGDPAFTPLLEIFLPNGVYLKRSETLNCENSEVNKIKCDLGEHNFLINDVTYQFELNVDEGLTETKLVYLFNSSTATLNRDDRSRFRIPLQVEREADFEIIGEPEESSYIYTEEETTLIRNIFTIEKFGPSPIPEIEISMMIPNKIKDSKGDFYKIAKIQEYEDKTEKNQLLKCEHVTDYEGISTVKRLRRADNVIDLNEVNIRKNKTYPILDPSNIVYINCTMGNVQCVQVKCLVGPFDKTENYAEVTMEMKINLKHFEDMLKPQQSILITWDASLSAENFTQSGNRSKFTQVTNLLIIEKQHKISLWILIGSAVVGVVILICLTAGLAKAGFFERKDYKKLIQLKEEAVDEERILEEMIERELTTGFIVDENEFYGFIRKRYPAQEPSEENSLQEVPLTQ